ncbi:MAG TPA: mycoredoxin [Chloroflexia bacterium]|nr:mycoredoxin [Chloroflexia bacterium]
MANSTPKVVMYATDWCGYCHSTKRFLERKGVPYEVVNIEQNEEAAEYVMSVNGGNRTVPTIEIEGKGVYTNPSPQQLTELLNLL